jgi:hypothetical protein
MELAAQQTEGASGPESYESLRKEDIERLYKVHTD